VREIQQHQILRTAIFDAFQRAFDHVNLIVTPTVAAMPVKNGARGGSPCAACCTATRVTMRPSRPGADSSARSAESVSLLHTPGHADAVPHELTNPVTRPSAQLAALFALLCIVRYFRE
jgi:hypothetical protein